MAKGEKKREHWTSKNRKNKNKENLPSSMPLVLAEPCPLNYLRGIRLKKPYMMPALNAYEFWITTITINHILTSLFSWHFHLFERFRSALSLLIISRYQYTFQPVFAQYWYCHVHYRSLIESTNCNSRNKWRWHWTLTSNIILLCIGDKAKQKQGKTIIHQCQCALLIWCRFFLDLITRHER